MSIFPIDEDIWKTIDTTMSGIKNKKYAAIAYIAEDGDTFLNTFKSGDLILCNASKGALKSGATSPIALKKLLDRGVSLFSRPDLHAKVVVTKSTVVLGSMNASWNSANYLKEAAVKIDDPKIAEYYKGWIKKLSKGTFKIDEDFLTTYSPFYKEPRHSPKKGVASKNHKETESIRFRYFENYDTPKSVQKSIDTNPPTKNLPTDWEFVETWSQSKNSEGIFVCMVGESSRLKKIVVEAPAIAIRSWGVGGKSNQIVTRWVQPKVNDIEFDIVRKELILQGVARLDIEKIKTNKRYEQVIRKECLLTTIGDLFQVDYGLIKKQLA